MAKNYLSQEELFELKEVVTMHLDYAASQARKHTPMHMADWEEKLDGFLRFNERNILSNARDYGLKICSSLFIFLFSNQTSLK